MADYTVQAGDTLSKIAKAHGTTVSELAKQNGIKDVNRIEIGQELSLGRTTAPVIQRQEESTIGLDSFEKQEKNNSYDVAKGAAIGFGSCYLGSMIYDDAKKYAPKIKTKTNNMKATARQNAQSVRNFLAQKAKHATKSAELHYAFGKDAIQNKSKNIADNVKNGAKKLTQKAKHATKSAELHYAFGKDALQKSGKKTLQKAKVGGRYTRFVANTKVAPKLIKGAGRFAGPIAAIYGMYEVKNAYNKGGEKAAVKQAIKTGGGLAGGWAGAKVGAAVGSFAGPVGTVVGGLIGGIGGYLLGEKLCS